MILDAIKGFEIDPRSPELIFYYYVLYQYVKFENGNSTLVLKKYEKLIHIEPVYNYYQVL